jgi:hypothetical protein
VSAAAAHLESDDGFETAKITRIALRIFRHHDLSLSPLSRTVAEAQSTDPAVWRARAKRARRISSLLHGADAETVLAYAQECDEQSRALAAKTISSPALAPATAPLADIESPLGRQAGCLAIRDKPKRVWRFGSTPDIVTQLKLMIAALPASSDASDDVRSYDLVWMLHLVGDAHQPLHTVGRFTKPIPNGDAGGNAESVIPATGETIVLHAYRTVSSADILPLTAPCSIPTIKRASPASA